MHQLLENFDLRAEKGDRPKVSPLIHGFTWLGNRQNCGRAPDGGYISFPYAQIEEASQKLDTQWTEVLQVEDV